MEWTAVGNRRQRRAGAAEPPPGGKETMHQGGAEWNRRLAAAVAAATTTPKRRQPGDRRRSEWLCATHGCSSSNWLASGTCRRCTAARSPECQVILGWEDMTRTATPGPHASGAVHWNVGRDVHHRDDGGTIPCPSTRTAPAAGAAAAATPKKVWPSPVRPGNPGGGASANAKTPLARARVTLDLAIAAAYPEAVLTTMKQHIEDLEKQEREHKPVGQRIDAARKRVREAEAACERADDAIATAQAARSRAADAVAAAQAALEQCMSEAAVEPTPAEAEDRDLLMASALHNILVATETTWPLHAGGPPERLVQALQAGAQALARQRSTTPPRSPTAPVAAVEDADLESSRAETETKSFEQLETELKEAHDAFADALKHGHKEAGDPMRVRILADISEQVVIARRLQFSPGSPPAQIAAAHVDARAAPY